MTTTTERQLYDVVVIGAGGAGLRAAIEARLAGKRTAIISVINTWDAVVAFQSGEKFGFGLGNIVLVVNVVMLWAYTLSCHSCRHITGGRLKHFSKHPVRYKLWTGLSKLNTRHMLFAWLTIGTLILADFYVMLVASGTISDLRIVN